jgi:glycosyltransferase involved in cell wall biosynthesis
MAITKYDPRVSVIIIFFNVARFIEEAIESVLAQTYREWELLLVDDGSTDDSADIARRYVMQNLDRIYYLEHPNHENRGMSASRNLGIGHANGEYIAFLDADDIWLPHKVSDQITLMESNLDAALVYGTDLYWYSWTGESDDLLRDYIPRFGIKPNKLYEPPDLLPLFLRGKAAIPCPTNIMVRRSAFDEVGGFEEYFRGLYEDQAFYAKVCMRLPVFASDRCWDKYRQHKDSSVAEAQKKSEDIEFRRSFLSWLSGYLSEQNVKDVHVWQALRRELWRLHYPGWLPTNKFLRYLSIWLKKWLLKVEERAAPDSLKQILWKQG